MTPTAAQVPPDPSLLERAARLLSRGGVVAFPTETVYGLGASALDPQAVARVFEIKGRPRFDPLIVHVGSLAEALPLVSEWPASALRLAERFWPGPLTLVLPKAPIVPDIVTSGLPTLAIRVPSHPVALELIARAGVPIAAPSANRFGHVSPTTAQHVREDLGSSVDLIVDGGPCEHGVESTVLALIDYPAKPAMLLRPGAVAAEELERIVGPLGRPAPRADHPLAPGMLERHYAPRTRTLLVPGPAQAPAGQRVGLITLSGPAQRQGFAAVEVLSTATETTVKLREAAANLFAAMRRLDALKLDLIIAEAAPEEGLGRAINDRLRRASASGG